MALIESKLSLLGERFAVRAMKRRSFVPRWRAPSKSSTWEPAAS